MRSTWLVLVVAVLGCGTDPVTPMGGTDTGVVMGVDSGTPGFDSGSPGFDSGSPGFDSGSPGFDSGVVMGTDTGVVMGTDSGSSGDPRAECYMRATSPSEMCACDMCLSQLQTCENDPGCVMIRECARSSGCRGIDCYGLITPGPCRMVIDANGGVVGQSGMNASALSTCVTMMCEM